MYDILMRKYELGSKKEIRAFFNQLRQEMLDWHGTVFGTPEFKAQEQKLTNFYMARSAK